MMNLPEFPYNVQIEVCNFCNAKCTTCPISTMKRKPKIMDFRLFKKIICELKEKNFVGQVLPFLNGESLLVPNFIDYLRFIKANIPKATVVLYTNASKLNDRLGRIILREGLLDTLVISFDGGTKESYELVRRGLSFENVRRNVHHFLKNRNELKMAKPRVVITMVVTSENRHTKQALIKEFKDADRINFSFMFNWGGAVGESKSKISKGKHFLTKSNFCRQMYNNINILVNGDVCLCCFDYDGREILGNLKRQSIQEVWLGKQFQIRRERLRKRLFSELPLCRNCNVINHNLIVQQLIKVQPLIEAKFPKFGNAVVNLYKSILFGK